MITTIIKALFSISHFVTGGNIISTNLKLHHYIDDAYKDIFHLRNNASISKNCTRHSEVEGIKKIISYGPNGLQNSLYRVTKNDVLESIQDK